MVQHMREAPMPDQQPMRRRPSTTPRTPKVSDKMTSQQPRGGKKKGPPTTANNVRPSLSKNHSSRSLRATKTAESNLSESSSSSTAPLSSLSGHGSSSRTLSRQASVRSMSSRDSSTDGPTTIPPSSSAPPVTRRVTNKNAPAVVKTGTRRQRSHSFVNGRIMEGPTKSCAPVVKSGGGTRRERAMSLSINQTKTNSNSNNNSNSAAPVLKSCAPVVKSRGGGGTRRERAMSLSINQTKSNSSSAAPVLKSSVNRRERSSSLVSRLGFEETPTAMPRPTNVESKTPAPLSAPCKDTQTGITKHKKQTTSQSITAVAGNGMTMDFEFGDPDLNSRSNHSAPGLRRARSVSRTRKTMDDDTHSVVSKRSMASVGRRGLVRESVRGRSRSRTRQDSDNNNKPKSQARPRSASTRRRSRSRSGSHSRSGSQTRSLTDDGASIMSSRPKRSGPPVTRKTSAQKKGLKKAPKAADVDLDKGDFGNGIPENEWPSPFCGTQTIPKINPQKVPVKKAASDNRPMAKNSNVKSVGMQTNKAGRRASTSAVPEQAKRQSQSERRSRTSGIPATEQAKVAPPEQAKSTRRGSLAGIFSGGKAEKQPATSRRSSLSGIFSR